MNVTDLIIIYLACGSPFAVFRLTQTNRVDWPSVILAFMLWPVYAVMLLGLVFFSNEARKKADLRNRLETLRLAIESSAFQGESISSLFEFREVYSRFTGLSVAADAAPSRSYAEIFEISGHPNQTLASRCLARRNAGKLAFHRSLARHEFVTRIEQLHATESNHHELERLAVELAETLEDRKAAQSFAAMTSIAHPPGGFLPESGTIVTGELNTPISQATAQAAGRSRSRF